MVHSSRDRGGGRPRGFSGALAQTATGGERTLTRRSLRCACGATTHPLCPSHTAIRHLSRGFVLLLDGHVFYDFGVIRAEHLAPFAARKALIYLCPGGRRTGDTGAPPGHLRQAAEPLLDSLHHLHRQRRRAVRRYDGLRERPVGQRHPGLFLGPAADRQRAPDFHRVPSASNVSDAISRGKDSRARAEGWTRVTTPVDDNMEVFARAAVDIDFACHVARERLLHLAIW